MTRIDKKMDKKITKIDTILSHRGYSIALSEISDTELEEYINELTIIPYVEKPEYQNAVEPIPIYTLTHLRLYGPRYWGLNKFGPAKNDKLTTSQAEKMLTECKFQGTPRPHQMPVIEKTLSELSENRGGILALSCGFGKTAIALYIASQLRVKTLVVSHTTNLMQQWIERIKQFIPQARIGIVQQSKADIYDKDIVIASLKTLALKEFPQKFFDSFGLVVWDEVHLMATQLFSQAFPKCATKYSIGLSATPFRKDKCETIFQHFIGPIIYMSKRDKDDAIKAQCIRMIMDEKDMESMIRYNFKGEILYTSTVVNVVNHPSRTDRIVDKIVEHANQGRKILVLSEYVKHLKDIEKKLAKYENDILINKRITQFHSDFKSFKSFKSIFDFHSLPNNIQQIVIRYLNKSLREYFKQNPLFTYGLYVGEMKNDERKISEEKDVILGTYKLASVGMDIPKLNTLIMASPRKDIEQSVGRILRKDTKKDSEKKDSKKKDFEQQQPLIIEIIDNHGIFEGQARARKEFYKEYGYTIENIKMDIKNGSIIPARSNLKSDNKSQKILPKTMNLSIFKTDKNTEKTKEEGFLFTDD